MVRMYTNDVTPVGEVRSIYDTPTLREKLKGYNSKKGLLALDIDNTISPDPTKRLVLRNIPRVDRWAKNPQWGFDLVRYLAIATLERWTKEDVENFSTAYAKEKVIPHFDSDDLVNWVKEAELGLYPNVKKFLDRFDKAGKLLVTKGFDVVVNYFAELLRIPHAYAGAHDKATAILDHIERQAPEVERVLLFGDMPRDMEAGEKLRRQGLDVDTVQVAKNGVVLDGATIIIPRHYGVLEALL
jgi:phosphoglycolate phosphatase-like HAD superfamily hydrolase